jgi:hypothetical protein
MRILDHLLVSYTVQSITNYPCFSQIVNPHNKNIRDIPGLAPPAMNRKLLSIDAFGGL